jgi:Uma2 family endonuclease
VADDIIIRVQNLVATHTHTQPEPDVFLLSPRDDHYTQGRPTPNDVLLLIEVSDSSLQYDQETKLSLYAEANLREVWIVNLPEESIDCYSGPTSHGYRVCERFFPGDTIHPDSMPAVALDVQYILNPLA